MDDKKYEEIGASYRFFLGWRHAEFAGMLALLYGVISLILAAYREKLNFIAWIPLIASPIGILFWIIDTRTRDLYHAAIDAGLNLEGDKGGFFTQLDKTRIQKGKSAFSKLSHSMAIDIICWGYTILLLIFSVYLFKQNN